MEKQNIKYQYDSKNINLNLEDFFGFTKDELTFFTFSKRLKYKIINIPKKGGGIRKLHTPVYKLKFAQKKILKELLYKDFEQKLSHNVTGFIPGKSIKDNAKFHIGKRFLIKLDIKDFFPSITRDRIYGMFRKDYNHQTSILLSGLCCYNNELPQGAPTSPMLANLVARFLDYQIIGLLKKYNSNLEGLELTYSRYADDLTFSFNEKINIQKFIDYIISIMLDEGFFPNYKKIHLISSKNQQRVTGIIVNDKIGVGRKYYKKFKSIFYNIQKNGFMQEMIKWNSKNNKKVLNIDGFKYILQGYLSYIKNISPEYYEKLREFNIDLKIKYEKNK